MGKRKIAIIGAGIGGLTLAYAFEKTGEFDVTIYSHKDANDIRNGRIPSSQVHFEKLIQKESLYDFPDYGPVHVIKKIQLIVNGQQMFRGHLNCRAVTLDQRNYLSSLIEGFNNREINFIKSRISPEDLVTMSNEYDLIIDCSGKVGPVADFPKSTEIEIPKQPLRVCSVGFFHGVEQDEENQMNYNILPELGELFEISTMTEHGLARAFLLEAVPGSALDNIKGDKGPEDFTEGLLENLKTFFPQIYSRINVKEFRLVDPMAYTRMAIKSEVRIPFTTINGTLLLGCGDSVVLNDPITGQGAQAASYCADMLYNVIMENKNRIWDETIGEIYWERTKEYVIKVTEWTNAMMGPLSESFSNLLGHATQNQETADEVVNLFHNPIKAHKAFFNH